MRMCGGRLRKDLGFGCAVVPCVMVRAILWSLRPAGKAAVAWCLVVVDPELWFLVGFVRDGSEMERLIRIGL